MTNNGLDVPLTPRPPSHLPPDLYKPAHSNSTHPSSSPTHANAFQASHPNWSHLLFPSHWHFLKHESAGAGPFTTKLVHKTPSGHRVHWESRKHRKRLKQHIEAPTASGQPTAQPPPRASLCWRMFPYKPGHIAWWTAVLFDIGSLCFVFSSICAFIPGVYNYENRDIGYVGWVAFTGSMFFTVGSFFQFGEVMSAPIVAMYHEMSTSQWNHLRHKANKGHALLNNQQQQQANGNNEHPSNNNSGNSGNGSDEASHPSATRANLSSLLFRLDFYVAFIQLIGAIAFSINTFAFSGSFILTVDETTGLVFFCDVFASCCFTISGYLAIMEITHSIIPFKPLPLSNSLLSVEWHITWNNFLGGIGFLLNGILIIYYPDPGQLPPVYPLLIGSVFFQIGSHLQYMEQADTHQQQQPQPQQQQQGQQGGQQHGQERQKADGDGHGNDGRDGQAMELQHQQQQQQQPTAEGRLERGDGGGGSVEDGRGAATVNGQYANGMR